MCMANQSGGSYRAIREASYSNRIRHLYHKKYRSQYVKIYIT